MLVSKSLQVLFGQDRKAYTKYDMMSSSVRSQQNESAMRVFVEFNLIHSFLTSNLFLSIFYNSVNNSTDSRSNVVPVSLRKEKLLLSSPFNVGLYVPYVILMHFLLSLRRSSPNLFTFIH